MLFTRKQNLAEKTIEFLAYHPLASLADIRSHLETSVGVRISKQAWYKTIRGLLRSEIIIKQNKIYSLNVAWADHLLRLSSFIENNYLSRDSSYRIALPVKEKQKIVYRFPDLISLDAFWAHILVLIATEFPNTPFYAYNPHFWYFAAHQFEAINYFESMKQHKSGNFTVVGARTDLDLWSEKLHPKKITHYYCSPKPIFTDRRQHLLSMADYLMTAKISKQMAIDIDLLFRETNVSKDAHEPPRNVIDFFKQKSPCSLAIVKDSQKSSQFAKKIKRFF